MVLLIPFEVLIQKSVVWLSFIFHHFSSLRAKTDSHSWFIATCKNFSLESRVCDKLGLRTCNTSTLTYSTTETKQPPTRLQKRKLT